MRGTFRESYARIAERTGDDALARSATCPVRIDIPEVLVHVRGTVVDDKRDARVPGPEMAAMKRQRTHGNGRKGSR